MKLGSLRVVFFLDPAFGFGIVDKWGEDWKREDVGVLFGVGPLNVVLEMMQDSRSIRVLDVLWALGSVVRAFPALFKNKDPLEELLINNVSDTGGGSQCGYN